MTQATMEQLFPILEAGEPGGLLDQAESALRSAGQEPLADAYLKLQQDAGLELNPEFDPDDRSNAPGPLSAALYAAYEPVTTERLQSVMTNVHQALPAGDLKNEFKQFMDGLGLAPPFSSPAPPAYPGPGQP